MSLLEVIGSTVVAAALIFAVIGLNVSVSGSSTEFGAELVVQQSMVEFTRTLQWDLAKTGYGLSTPRGFLLSKPDTMMFLGDVDNNGTIDSVKYFKGSVSTLSRTQNPRDFLLYRVIRRDTMKINVGLTRFDVTYLDSTGSATSVPGNVRGVKILARVESPSPASDGQYAGTYWESSIYPRNLNKTK